MAAPLYLRTGDWSQTRAAIDADNLLQSRTASSGRRRSRELVQRLTELTDAELAIIADGLAQERSQIMWVAACRRYALVGAFAEEVLRGRLLMFTPHLGVERLQCLRPGPG